MAYKLIAGGAMLVLLAGCATSPADCDPASHTGFLSTASCVGMYGKRQEKLADDIEAERNLNVAFREMLVSVEAERQEVASQRRTKEADMAAMNRSWDNLKASLSVKAQTNADLQSRVDTLQNRMNDVNASRGLNDAEKEKRLDNLRRQVQLLMSELEAGIY